MNDKHKKELESQWIDLKNFYNQVSQIVDPDDEENKNKSPDSKILKIRELCVGLLWKTHDRGV